jgi:DNA-binding response OmpR family regulator
VAVKSKKKALKSLTQSKVVSIGEYRNLRQGREAQCLAVVTKNQAFFDEVKKGLPSFLDVRHFDGRFSFEQALKSKEWDALILDERELKDEALGLCEKLKRQSHMDELLVVILSNDSSKDRVRQGLEKGCDEWVTKPEDVSSLVRLLDHHLNFK